MADRDGPTPLPQAAGSPPQPPSSLNYAVRRPNTAQQIRDPLEGDAARGGGFQHVAGPRNCPVDYFRPPGVPQPVVFHGSHAWMDYAAAAATPSPAAYNPKLSDDVTHGFIPKGDRFKDLDPIAMAEQQELPGPAHYTLTHTFKDKRMAMKFRAGARRPLDNQSGAPGPGNYDPNYPHLRNVTRQIKFPKAIRGDSAGRDGSPGPGGYETAVSGFKKTGGQIRTDAKRELPWDRPTDTDGPLQAAGTYPAAQVYSIPKAKRGGDNTAAAGRGTPGPGSYEPLRAAHTVTRGAPNVSFPGAPRRGPAVPTLTQSSTGAYNPQRSQTHKGGTFARGARDFEQATGESGDPGPGHYDASQSDRLTRKAPRASRIAARTKQPGAMTGNPGPGTYDPPSPGGDGRGRGVSVGHGPRGNLAGDSAAPGPGAYETTSTTNQPTRKCLTRIRPSTSSGSARDPFGAVALVGRASLDVPYYDTRRERSTKLHISISKHGRQQAKAGGNRPGPGAYSPMYKHTGRGGPAALLYLTG